MRASCCLIALVALAAAYDVEEAIRVAHRNYNLMMSFKKGQETFWYWMECLSETAFCYVFYRPKYSYASGKKYCEDLNLKLLSIKQPEEITALLNYLPNPFYIRENNYTAGYVDDEGDQMPVMKFRCDKVNDGNYIYVGRDGYYHTETRGGTYYFQIICDFI